MSAASCGKMSSFVISQKARGSYQRHGTSWGHDDEITLEDDNVLSVATRETERRWAGGGASKAIRNSLLACAHSIRSELCLVICIQCTCSLTLSLSLHVYIYIYIHTYIHTYIPIHIYTYVCVSYIDIPNKVAKPDALLDSKVPAAQASEASSQFDRFFQHGQHTATWLCHSREMCDLNVPGRR